MTKISQVTRTLLACGVIAGPLFILVAVIQVLTRPGFDIGRHPISLLSLGNLGWVQIANFVACGLLVIGFAIGVRLVLHPGKGDTFGPLLFGAYGTGLIIAGVFPPDPSLGFPPGTPETIPATLSLNAMLHGLGFVLAFGSVTLAFFMFALRDASLNRRGWAACSVAIAFAALALIMWPGQEGISIRYLIAAVIVMLWTSVLAVRLMMEQ